MQPPAIDCPLGPEAYHAEAFRQRELSTIFSRNWLFAGFSKQLTEHDSFVTVRLADKSIVLRNSHGRLLAFHNVCSHRHAILRPEPCGKGPLRCGYHGWTYDDQGQPVGVPGQKENFGFDPEERSDWTLEQFDVDRAGPFVFVRLTRHGPSLREWLGDYWHICLALDDAFAIPFEWNTQLWRCNWKYGVENTLETYHVGFCHAESLAQMYDQNGRISFTQSHSTIHHPMFDKSIRWWDRALKRADWQRHARFADYQHFFIYPNLCLGLTYGGLLSVQTFEPTTSETSQLTYRLCLPDSPSTDVLVTSFRETLRDYFRDYNQQVLNEDRVPVELCQVGCREQSRHGCLGRCEIRVIEFLKLLSQDVAGDSALPIPVATCRE